MATYVQRTISICDAIVNGTSTQAQQNAIVSALLPNMPAEWTNAQKCEAFIREARARLIRLHQEQIQRTGIDSAITAAASQASSDIPEA